MINHYFFILGRNSALSVAEIEVKLKNIIKSRHLGDGYYIIEATDKISPKIQQELGGIIKFGEIVFESSAKSLMRDATQYISKNLPEKRLRFGVNNYGSDINPINIKKELKANGTQSRLVESKEKTLSSVITQKEILNKDGIELNLFKVDDKILAGRTLACQPFEEFSFRDWERPAIDRVSGMLPPKLARIMINLGGMDASAVLFDPFCGSGTVLMEAALLGYSKILGSDISEKAVSDTKTNFEWMVEKKLLKNITPELFQSDIRKLDKPKENSVDLIVTEPYLGPPLKANATKDDIYKIKSELEDLYSDTFKVFTKILKDDGRVVIIMPAFLQDEAIYLDILDKIKKLGFEMINPIKHTGLKFDETTSRGGMLYSREDQRVGREIFVFKKR